MSTNSHSPNGTGNGLAPDSSVSEKTALDKTGNESAVEKVKRASNFLRGTIAAGLGDQITGGLAESDTNLIKFHGIYQQDDRDIRNERFARKLEPAYSFMIRLRIPGGLLTARQWLAIDAIAEEMTDAHSIRLTNRQTIQFHGIAKKNLKPVIASYHRSELDSIAACGDVNRNVLCSAFPELSALHREVYHTAKDISAHLLPKTRAYYEIWLDEEKIAAPQDAADADGYEPIYGRHYLPRKFKIALAVPPTNDVDVYANDIGLVAIADGETLVGFNVLIGGGLGMSHGDATTYPRAGSVIGFCPKEHIIDCVSHILMFQRDNGNRENRKNARLKYTIDRIGLAEAKRDIEQRLGFELQQARPVYFSHRGDFLGWHEYADGKWALGLFVENGRISDDAPLRRALREIAAMQCCDFLCTANQNIALVSITARERVEAVLRRYAIDTDHAQLGGLRKNAMACVALPTCPLAMAEAERYLPSLVGRIETVLEDNGLSRENIVIRMTGCPNGCARPYLAEIGLVGKSLGHYNLYLGASFAGDRLATLVAQNMDEERILATLTPLIARYSEQRLDNEHFGDFLHRQGVIPPPA